MKPARAVHVLFGIAAIVCAIACLVGTDRLVPGIGGLRSVAVASQGFRGVAVIAALFGAAGVALMFPSTLKRRFSPRQRSGYLVEESAWYALGYFCFVVGALAVVLLLSERR